jgi:hypothetical protein
MQKDISRNNNVMEQHEWTMQGSNTKEWCKKIFIMIKEH